MLPLTRGVFRGSFGGQTPPPLLRKFFNLLGFFKKKMTKPKFSRQYKKFLNPLPQKFLDKPLPLTELILNDINI